MRPLFVFSFLQVVGLKEQKMVFPFGYITSHDKLNEKQLPSEPGAWFNVLKQEDANQLDIDRALADFNSLGCKSIKEYLGLLLTFTSQFVLTCFLTFSRILPKT